MLILMLGFSCVMLIALSGCVDTPPPAIEVRTVTVSVPIATACVSPAQVPAEPPHIGSQLNGDAAHDLDIVSASAIRLRSYAEELSAIVTGCEK